MMKKEERIMANTQKTDYPEPGQALTAKSDSNNIAWSQSSIFHFSFFIVNSAACGGLAPPPPVI
jgi:hypothetical protein